MTEMSDPKVTEADREAASLAVVAMATMQLTNMSEEAMLEVLIQAFARHREQAVKEERVKWEHEQHDASFVRGCSLCDAEYEEQMQEDIRARSEVKGDE